jgi:Tfp pilus assembly protein PilN
MRSLHLDFLHPAAPPARFGLVLLLAGVIAATLVGWRFIVIDREASALATRVAETEQMSKRGLAAVKPLTGDPKIVAQEVAQANAVLASLTVPWDVMFRSLESARGDQVGLLGIQPEGSGRNVRIAGEARRYEDILGYLKRLESTEGFSNVFLAAHEIKTADNTRAITFTLTAEWSARP